MVIKKCLEMCGIRWRQDRRWLISVVWGVSLEKKRGLKLCRATHSKVQHFFGAGAVGIAWASWITKHKPGTKDVESPSNSFSHDC